MASRLERLIRIEQQINQQRYPGVETLCRMFSVKPRTIFDDIRLLKQGMGLNIQFDRNRNGYYNAEPGNRLPLFDLTVDEMYALLVGCEILMELRTLPEDVVESALCKIVSRLPEQIVSRYGEMRDVARRVVREGRKCAKSLQ